MVLLCRWRIVDADLWRTHLVCRTQIARTSRLIVVRRERILSVTGEHLRAIIRLIELSAHCRNHSEVVIRSEGRQFALLRHKSRRDMRAVTRAVEVLSRMVSVVQTEMSKAKTVTETGIR